MKSKKRGNHIRERHIIQLILIYFEPCQRYFLFFPFYTIENEISFFKIEEIMQKN